VRPRKTKSEIELAIRAELRREPQCANLVFSIRYSDVSRTKWTVVPPPGHGWAPHCWRLLEKVAVALPIIMRETSIELGAERHAFELGPPPKVDVFPGGRWTASPRADVPREYWTAFRRAVRRLQHEVEIVREQS